MVTPAARREAIARAVESHGVSERRACRVMGADRSTTRYRSRRPDDAALRARLRELAAERRRFGYRRLHILLRGEGYGVSLKKTQRLYREEGLIVRPRKGRKRALGARIVRVLATLPNQRWSLGAGLSGTLCARPVAPSRLNEPFVEHNGELGLCLEPLARGHLPLSGGIAQDEKQ
jgi:transposase InsO family protein